MRFVKGDLNGCLDLLVEEENLSRAAFFARLAIKMKLLY